MSTQTNVRLPEMTDRQLQDIMDAEGLTKTQIIIIAVDRFYSQLRQDAENGTMSGEVTPGEIGIAQAGIEAAEQD